MRNGSWWRRVWQLCSYSHLLPSNSYRVTARARLLYKRLLNIVQFVEVEMGRSWSSLKLLLQLLGQMLVLVSRVSSWRDPIEHDHEDKSVHIGYLLEDFSRAGAINNTTTRTSQSTLGIYWRISAERERSTSLSKTLRTTDSFATIISGKVERVPGIHKSGRYHSCLRDMNLLL